MIKSKWTPHSKRQFVMVAAAIATVTRCSTAQPIGIDEKSAAKILYVAPGGSDAAAGDKAKPFATIQKAVDSAGNAATKIVLADGVYRNYVNVNPGDNLLIFEAQNVGKAVLSGADVVTGWKKSATEGVIAHEWTGKWGVGTELGWWGSTALNRRREMVFVNEARLTQRADDKGGAIALEDLKVSEFTVDEAKAQIFLRLRAGLESDAARIEMATRGYDTAYHPQTQAFSRPLFYIEQHSNIVLRGLVVKRAATYMKFGPALAIEGSQNTKSAGELPQNVLIDRCVVTENNGIGMEISNYRNVLVQNSRFNDNGERGAGMIQVGAERNADPKTLDIAPRNYRFEDCQFNNNNWRMAGTWGEMNDSAGFKAFGQNANGLTFVRCQFNGNQANGFWQDYAGSNTVLDHCLIEKNSGTGAGGYGVLSEMTRGPITVKNCVIRNNSNAGFISSGSPNVTIQDSFLYHNNFTPGKTDNYWCHEIRINSDTGRGSGDFEFSLKGWKLTGNTFASRGGDMDGKPVIGYLFQIGGEKFPDGLSPAAQFAKYVVSENNVFSKNPADHANGTGYKILYSPDATDNKPSVTLQQWQAQSNANGQQDQKSKFVYPLDLSNIADPTQQKLPAP